MDFPFTSMVWAPCVVSSGLWAAVMSHSGRKAPKVALAWSSPRPPRDRNTAPRLHPVTSTLQEFNYLGDL